MSGSKTKNLRQEIKAAIKELLPEILKDELYKEINKKVDARLTHIQKYMEDVLAQVDNRSKSMQSMLIKQIMLSKPNK